MIGGTLALGSWLAARIGLLSWSRRSFAAPCLEDRTLREQLPGYAEYAEGVRYRVFPGVW
jgi:protein-S-isoprenylcysteine O-methyltransferase Ste14